MSRVGITVGVGVGVTADLHPRTSLVGGPRQSIATGQYCLPTGGPS
jgi:hypothetical protein